jgi:hypothetical protein
VEPLWSVDLDPLSGTEEIFMAGGGNETLLINRHVIGTCLDKSVPKTCPQIERSAVAVPAALCLQAF